MGGAAQRVQAAVRGAGEEPLREGEGGVRRCEAVGGDGDPREALPC